jgi:Ca-activated chloride channel family protein
MNWAHPERLQWIWWVALYGALACGLVVWQWLSLRKAMQASLAKRLGPHMPLWRALLRLGLLMAGGFYLLRALAVSQGEPVKIDSPQVGADVVLAVDVSTSMYVQDLQPNRLSAAKACLSEFINRLGGDRVGLVAFAGDAVVACPMTTDYETAQLFLEKLESDSVPADGTGLAKALEASLDRFPEDKERGRLIVLASDGEDLAGSGVFEQARRAKELGVSVIALGTASPGGGLVPGERDMFGRVVAKMWQGQPVRSRLEEATLRRVAELSGGEYFRVENRQGLERALAALRSLKQGRAQAPARWVREPLYQKDLLWAFLLFLFEASIPLSSHMLRHRMVQLGQGTRRFASLIRHRRGWGQGAGLVVGLLVLGSALQAKGFSLDPGRGEYDQGNQQYRSGDFQGAATLYRDSLEQQDKRGQAHYNLGNSLYRQGDYASAAQEYEKALQLEPSDADAAFNLDLARKRMEEQKQDPDSKKDKKDGKKDGNKDGKQGQNQNSQGQQGKQGQSQGNQPGKPGQGKGRPSQDEMEAMMKMLQKDQQRYGQAFNPHKRFPKKKDQPQDPMQQMIEQMTGMRVQPQEQAQPGPARKDW